MDSLNDETDEPSILSTVQEQNRQKQIAKRETEQKVKINTVPLDILQNVESFFDRIEAKHEKENHAAEHYDKEFDEELNGIIQYMADDLPSQSLMIQDTLNLPLHVPLLEHISEIEEIYSSSEEEDEEEEIVPPKLLISATRSRSNSNVPPLTNLSARIAASTQNVEDLLNTSIATIVNTNAIDLNTHNRDEDETAGNTAAPPVVDFNSSLFPKIIFGKVRNSHANNSSSLLPTTSENSVSKPLASEAAKTKKLQKSLKSAQRQQFTEQTRHMDMTIKTLMEQQLQLFTHTLKSELNKKNEGLIKLARIVDKEHKTLLTIQETLSTQKTFIGEQERWQQQLLNILKHMTENFIAVTSNITNSNATAAANTQSYRTLETNYDSIRKMLNIMVVTLQTMSEAVAKYQVELNVVQRVANQQQVDHHSMLRMVEDRSSNTIDTQQKTITVLEENKKSLQTKNKGLKRQVETLQNELIRTQYINKSVMGYLEQQNLSIKFEYVDAVPDSYDETRIVPSPSNGTKKSNSSTRKH